MHHAAPFLLTKDYVQRAGLLPGDVGKWCLLVKRCHHVFDNEVLARYAHEKLLKGISVR